MPSHLCSWLYLTGRRRRLWRTPSKNTRHLCGRAAAAEGRGLRGCSRIRDVLASGGRKAVGCWAPWNSPWTDCWTWRTWSRRDPGASAVMSGLKALDQSIGGFAPSELSVWTGKRGSGKSTLLSQLASKRPSTRDSRSAYSGELVGLALLQAVGYAAGRRGQAYRAEAGPGVREAVLLHAEGDHADRIDGWWKGKFFLYDNRVAGAGTRTVSFPCSSMPSAGSAAVYSLWTI